jgi:hypothetical protein
VGAAAAAVGSGKLWLQQLTSSPPPARQRRQQQAQQPLAPLVARADGASSDSSAVNEDEYRRAEALLVAAGFGPTDTARSREQQQPPPQQQPQQEEQPREVDTAPPRSDLCAPFVRPNSSSTAQRVLVIGGGVMGSAAAYSIARRNEGHQVTLIDTGHPIRSSWGQERAARLAYDEPLFVQMMQRAFSLWGELEQSDPQRRKILRPGVRLDVAPRGVLDSLRETQSELGLALTVFSSQEELNQRYPQIKLRDGEEAVLTEGM